MNATKPENKMSNKLKVFYGIIILVCIIMLVMAIYSQIAIENEVIVEQPEDPLTGQEKIEKNKAQFNSIFDNAITEIGSNNYKIDKINGEKEIVYMGYQNTDKKANNYDLNVNIPYINIENDTIEKFNKEIKETFEKKAKNILNNINNNTIYSVKYKVYVTNNILSVVIRSTLKEDNNPQRDIVQTYNYDLEKHKECKIDDMLEMKGITAQEANKKISEGIEEVQATVSELEKLGYNVYSRDPKSDIYNIKNVTEYYIGEDNVLYIIFAYGNQNHTSEMDIILM